MWYTCVPWWWGFCWTQILGGQSNIVSWYHMFNYVLFNLPKYEVLSTSELNQFFQPNVVSLISNKNSYLREMSGLKHEDALVLLQLWYFENWPIPHPFWMHVTSYIFAFKRLSVSWVEVTFVMVSHLALFRLCSQSHIVQAVDYSIQPPEAIQLGNHNTTSTSKLSS